MKRIFTTLSQKWPEYLLEVLVITVGILGAFTLNNWKEQRAEHKAEISVLKNLSEELSDNLKKFEKTYDYQKVRSNSIKALLTLNKDEISAERLDLLMDSVSWNWSFDPSMGMFESLINSGNIKSISNEQLRLRLANYGDFLQDYLEEEIYSREVTQAALEPYMIKSYPLKGVREVRTEQSHPGLKDELLLGWSTMEYKNILLLLDSYMIGIIEEGLELKKEMRELIDQINEELER